MTKLNSDNGLVNINIQNNQWKMIYDSKNY